MEKRLQEIEERRRQGVGELELWRFILSSDPHSKIWEQAKPEGKRQLQRWKEILNWVDDLNSSDTQKRKEAVEALASFKKTVEVIPALVEALKDKVADVRFGAIGVLGAFEEEALTAVPGLLEVLEKDPDPYVRREAVWALGEIRGFTGETVPALIKALDDADSYVRFNAVESLGKFRKQSQKVIPVLIKTLQDKDPRVRRHVTSVLGRTKEKSKPVSQALIKAFQDSDVEVQYESIEALGKLQVQEASSIFLAGLKHKETYIRVAATNALGRLRDKMMISSLIQTLKDPELIVRQAAIFALEGLSDSTLESEPIASIIQALFIMLEDAESEVRLAAIVALGKFKKNIKEGVSLLFASLQDPKISLEAAKLLGFLSLSFPEIKKKNFFQQNSELKHHFLTERVRRAYQEKKALMLKKELEFLATTNDKESLKIVALYYAWQGKQKKALSCAKKISESPTAKIYSLLQKNIEPN